MSIGNPRWPPQQENFNIGSYNKSMLKLFLFEATERFEKKLARMCLGVSYTKCVILRQSDIQYVRIGGHSYNVRPCGKMKTKISETRILIEHKGE